MPKVVDVTPADPPPPRGRRPETTDWVATLALVAKGRGRWFRVGDYSPTVGKATATHVRKVHDRDGRFEIVSRTVNGRGVIYARLKQAT